MGDPSPIPNTKWLVSEGGGRWSSFFQCCLATSSGVAVVSDGRRRCTRAGSKSRGYEGRRLGVVVVGDRD